MTATTPTSAAVPATDPSARIDELRTAIEQRLAALLPAPEQASTTMVCALRAAVLAPGKRLRPLLTLLIAQRRGTDWRPALDAACAVELVHAASLILDDLPAMDDAEERRGEPALHRRFGEDTAILAAVALMNRAYATVVQCPALAAETRLAMVGDLADTLGVDGLVAGQWLDLHPDDRDNGAVPQLEAINHRKTGLLFRLAVDWGARAGGASDPERWMLIEFADALGLAYQALDDLIDAAEDDPTMNRTAEGHAAVSRHLQTARAALADDAAVQDGLLHDWLRQLFPTTP